MSATAPCRPGASCGCRLAVSRTCHSTTLNSTFTPQAVDAVVQRLAHAHVGERAALAQAVEPGPDMRVGAGGDGEAGLLEAVDAVGRGHLDPIDLAAAECREAGVRLGDRPQQDLCDACLVRRVPVGVVAGQGDGLAGGDGLDPERAVPATGSSATRPQSCPAFERVGRGEQDVHGLVREVGGRGLGGDGDGAVVDLAVGAHGGHPGAHEAGTCGLELRAVGLEEAVEVSDHRVGVEPGPVMEGDAGAEVEDPGLLVVGRLLPGGGEAGAQGGGLAGGG